jgi:excinuclease UvrABC nuclease subunit
MSHREELEKLANACEECWGKDMASLDEHLERCPVCQEYKMKSEKINQMVEAVHMFASKPEDERRKILGARMDQFSTMPEEKRIIAISDMLDSIAELSEEDRIKILKTRADIIASLPGQKNVILMGSLKKVLEGWPEERKMMERQAVIAATQDYFILKRMIVRKMFKKMLE